MIEKLTTAGEALLCRSSLPGFQRAAGTAALTVEVKSADQQQEILGFGAAFTDASCYLFSRLSSEERASLFAELFSPDGLALSVCRTMVGQSDYGRECYSYDDTPDDRDLEHFSIAYDTAYIIPMIREALAVNPDLFLFSSPWSPPGWMKTSGTMRGGWMRAEFLEIYARYYLRYLEEYAKAGVPIHALTTQNEPETDQDGKMPACLWHPDFERAFVRDYLSPLLRQHGLDVKIWLNDHNYNHWIRAKYLLDDPQVRAVADGVAFHGYGGEPEMMTRLLEAHPGTRLHWTEGGPGAARNYATEWCYWGKRITDAMRNGCRSFTGWNLALDEKGTPNIGPFGCRGLVTIDSRSGEITRSGQYYAFAHISPFLQRGAVRLGSTGEGDVMHLAFRNPDGRLVLLLTNPGAACTVQVVWGQGTLPLELPADSMTTLAWGEA